VYTLQLQFFWVSDDVATHNSGQKYERKLHENSEYVRKDFLATWFAG
jgi:hypothetical protein